MARQQRNRMKWSQYGRITLALMATLSLGLSMTACNPSFTLGFVYALSAQASPGQISTYTIDSVSGALTPAAASPYSSGGQFPVASAVDNRAKWLYVVNEVSNSIVQFGIGTGATLQQLNTYNTPGTYPISVTIDSQSRYLFVVDTFAPAFNAQISAGLSNGDVKAPVVNPPSYPAANFPTYGCVAVYPISYTDGSLGTPIKDPVSGQNCFPLNGQQAQQGSQPVGVTATGFVSYLYVADQGTHTVYGYSVNYSTGVLTAISNNNYQSGVKPSAITSDPTGRFVYVTDEYSNQLLGYDVQNDGSLQAMLNGPFLASLYPDAVLIDPRGLYLYIANYNANNVAAYSINAVTGNPAENPSGAGYSTGTGPTCLAIELAYGRFIYTSNLLDNTVSGFELDPHTGNLTSVLNAPFAAGQGPTCVQTAANGSHPVQTIGP
jgi:6-phosphogluconolactonase